MGIIPHTIVDLGSFDGGDAYRFKQSFPEARVITVEADPTRFAFVSKHLANEDIETLNVAACDQDGDVDWFAATIDGQTDSQGSIFQHINVYRDKFPMVKQADAPV